MLNNLESVYKLNAFYFCTWFVVEGVHLMHPPAMDNLDSDLRECTLKVLYEIRA